MNNCVFFFFFVLLSTLVFIKIRITCLKYKIESKNKLSGFEVARKILDENNLQDMYIIEAKGSLVDYYDSQHKVIKLSTDVFHGETVMAAVVAAYQCGKAILDKQEDKFYKFQIISLPIVTILTYLSYILFLIALLLHDEKMVLLSVSLVFLILLFHIVCLPNEFKNKEHVLSFLKKYKLLNKKEMEEANIIFKQLVFSSISSIVLVIIQFITQIFDSIHSGKN